MSTEIGDEELSVARARDRFSEVVNRAHFGEQITYVTRGRNHERAAAVVPAAMVADCERLREEEKAREAQQRLEDIRAGHTRPLTAAEAAEELGL